MKIHTIEKGETLWQIAQAHDVSLDELIDANPDITDPNDVWPGQILAIPEDSKPGVVVPNKQPCRPQRPSDSIEDWETQLPRPMIYVVKSGDTLYNLAQAFGLTVADIMAVNRQISDADQIMAGQKLFIPRLAPTNPGSNRPVICPHCGMPYRK